LGEQTHVECIGPERQVSADVGCEQRTDGDNAVGHEAVPLGLLVILHLAKDLPGAPGDDVTSRGGTVASRFRVVDDVVPTRFASVDKARPLGSNRALIRPDDVRNLGCWQHGELHVVGNGERRHVPRVRVHIVVVAGQAEPEADADAGLTGPQTRYGFTTLGRIVEMGADHRP
jgi:hypothetical protein